MRIRRSSRRSSLTSATSRSRSGGDRPGRRKARTSHACHGIRIRSALFTDYASIRDDFSRKAMTVEPNRFELGGPALKQLARRTRDHIERTPRRNATVVPRLEYAPPWATMNSTSPWGPPCSCTRETSGYSPCSRSRVRVSREKRGVSPRASARYPPWRAGHARGEPPTPPAFPTRFRRARLSQIH